MLHIAATYVSWSTPDNCEKRIQIELARNGEMLDAYKSLSLVV